MHYQSLSYRMFNICNYLFLCVLSIICILPLIHIFAVSLSASWAAEVKIVSLWPVGFNLNAYMETFNNPNFMRAISISVGRSILGMSLTMFLISMAAYSLSRSDRSFPGRSIYAWFFVVTMLFEGGLIPTYLVVTSLGLKNTIWALILPPAVNVWLMILLMNFFRSLPKELEEAALMDGASHFASLFRIYLPVSKPAVATLSLFLLVFHWNEWFSGLIYMSNVKDYPVSTFLRTIVVAEDYSQLDLDPRKIEMLSNRSLKASQIFIGILPILLVYPFLQKYFVKGIVVGSVKE